MPEISKDEIDKIVQKYKGKIAQNLEAPEAEVESELQAITTVEYAKFRNQYMPKHLSWYEKGCQQAENLIKMKPDAKKEPKYLEAIETCHLNITPGGAVSFALLVPFVIILVGSLMSFMLFQSMFFVMFFMLMGIAMMGPLNKLPFTLAERWRMRAGSQMVLSIFYMVTYMRHTSNLELAINFSADHIGSPLNLDLKKVLWNVETEKYPNIQDSLEAYLDQWKDYNPEFVESVHLIEGSLFETAEDRRVDLLDKSLTVILDETYEKMLHYAQNLKGPITMLHMMGVILPILGLVILPLVVSFMEGVEDIKDFLGSSVNKILFIPYARPSNMSHDNYTTLVRNKFRTVGLDVDSIHDVSDKKQVVKDSQAIYVGGGNVSRLLRGLYEDGIIEAISEHVDKGTPYIGASAGVNVAAPSISLTPDTPIVDLSKVQGASHEGLNLFPFHVWVHYFVRGSNREDSLEDTDTKIMEFLGEQDTIVVGMAEGSILRIENGKLLLKVGYNKGVTIYERDDNFIMGESKREFKISEFSESTNLEYLINHPKLNGNY